MIPWQSAAEMSAVREAAERPESAPLAREMDEFDCVRASYRPLEMTEGGYLAENGSYAPGHIERVDAEAQEFDPEMKALAGELDTWIEQGEAMSCAVASQTMALNQLEGGGHTEEELLEIGCENGWYDEGTCPDDVGKIAESMGLDVHRYFDRDISALRAANDPGVKVIANVDNVKLMYPDCPKLCEPNHCVQVLRVESTPRGEVVILNDPGREDGRGAVYPIEVFAKAYDGDMTTIRKGALAS